jgi:serine/threonine protein kinase
VSFLCPSCHTPLPPQRERTLLSCSGCGVSIDLRDVDTAPGAPGLSPERDLSGQVLGAYRLGARLGSGGMGIVYAAEGPEGAVAVKVLARGAASDPALRTRFRREAEALLALVHPAVVRVYAHGEHEGVAWYAMERLEGEDLARRLARGPLPIAEVQALAEQLLSGLACIHARGLVHRDLKPSNVLLFPSGAKLCDFGVARVEGARTLTESAALVGSLAYMAPEQRRGRSSAASDLYALGVLLCEAATHRLPEELSLDELQPRRLRALVTHLLAVRPEDRPASAEHARAMLVGAEGRGRQRRAAMVVGLLVVMVGVSLVVLERSWRPSAPASSPPLSAGVDDGARTVASGASVCRRRSRRASYRHRSRLQARPARPRRRPPRRSVRVTYPPGLRRSRGPRPPQRSSLPHPSCRSPSRGQSRRWPPRRLIRRWRHDRRQASQAPWRRRASPRSPARRWWSSRRRHLRLEHESVSALGGPRRAPDAEGPVWASRVGRERAASTREAIQLGASQSSCQSLRSHSKRSIDTSAITVGRVVRAVNAAGATGGRSSARRRRSAGGASVSPVLACAQAARAEVAALTSFTPGQSGQSPSRRVSSA